MFVFRDILGGVLVYIQISDWNVENTGCRNNTGVLVGTTEDIDLIGHAKENIDLLDVLWRTSI